MANDREVTLRRTLQQVGHCIDEALSVLEHSEDLECAVDDIEQAVAILQDRALPMLKSFQHAQARAKRKKT